MDMPQLFKELKPTAPEILLGRDIQCMLQTISKVETYSYHNQTEINNKHIQITVKVETFKESIED